MCIELPGSCFGEEMDLCDQSQRRLDEVPFFALPEREPVRFLMSHEDSITEVNVLGDKVLAKAETAATIMVDTIYTIDPEIKGARSNLATRQLMLREKMMKDALMVSMNAASKADLYATIEEFSVSQNILLNGNGETGKDSVGRTEIDRVRRQMEKVEAAWNAFKPVISSIQVGSDVSVLADLDNSSTILGTEMQAAGDLYTTVVMTTTKAPVDILFPLPLSGVWDPGHTMRTAALIAQDIINKKQTVLPGYLIKHTFLESKCDGDYAMRNTLKEFAATDKWVALGGMACYAVCKTLAIVSASMFVPTVSYGCNGESLSDTSIFPDFVRLGTKTTAKKDVVGILGNLFEWKHIAVVSGDPGRYRAKAQKLMDDLKTRGFSTSYASALDSDWGAAKANMADLIKNKYRQVFFMGNDHYFRVLLCAAIEAGMTTGMTWISEEVRRRSWWTEDDPEILKHDSRCTGAALSQHLQGAINIAGLGAPLGSDADKPLDCFDGHTSNTFRQAVMDALANGWSAELEGEGDGKTNESGALSADDMKEERPYDEMIGLVADGTCLIAKSVRRMVDAGYDIATLRTPSSAVYKDMVKFLRAENFTGASGYVTFNGNDKPGYLGIWQVRANESILVGHVDPNEINITLSYEGGLRNDTWTAAPPDVVEEEFPWVVIPAVFIGVWQCGAIILGLCRSHYEMKAEAKLQVAVDAAAAGKTLMTSAEDSKTADKEKEKNKEKKGWFGKRNKAAAAEDAQLLGNPAEA